MTGNIVAVSALLPAKASTVSGNPDASVSNPRVMPRGPPPLNLPNSTNTTTATTTSA
jgi:hypothetical protein